VRLEIACDESGSEGEKLVGGQTDVFAHAGVRLSTESAAECVRETRSRIGSPAQEYKANHLLRTKNRPVLVWLLEPAGPIHGNAHVYLVEKSFSLLRRIPGGGTLHREGRSTFGPELWDEFLDSFNGLLRISTRGVRPSLASFYQLVDVLRAGQTPAHRIMEELWRARPFTDPIPGLDPMMAAIAEAVSHWSAGGNRVSITHDEQPALTEDRIARLKQTCDRLSGLRFVDSRADPRVQVADFLAGVARRIASEELNGRGDAELTGLLRPYVIASSVWGDDRSGAELKGCGHGR
jgi:hypothetical protein